MSPVPAGRLYDDDFYGRQDAAVRDSAEAIVPLVLDTLTVRSAVDVGCGIGTWLSILAAHGVDDVMGVDGPHVAPSALQIPADRFVARDLERPLDLGRRFDLALSLEVAEHLDAAAATTFVASLAALAPAVLFSAAVPHQGGRHHVNEQWQDWWAARFGEHDMVPVDLVRPRVWDDDRVLPWYAQNCLLYVDAATLAACGLEPASSGLRLVHPRMWELVHEPPPSLRGALGGIVRNARDLPRLAGAAVRRRVGR